MTTATYDVASPRLVVGQTDQTQADSGFWARLFQRLMDARMMDADRQVRIYAPASVLAQYRKACSEAARKPVA